MALFAVTIGGIYAGVFSPTEAASVGAFGAIVLGVIGRQLSVTALLKAIETTVVTCGLLFVIIFGANLFSFFMVQTHLPNLLADGAKALELPGVAVMALIVVAYIILGCFLEAIGMVLITVPVFLPLVKSFGYDPVWFAIIVVIVVEVGLIHPAGRDESVRAAGAGARHQDHQHLSRHHSVPVRAADPDRHDVPLPRHRALVAEAILRVSPPIDLRLSRVVPGIEHDAPLDSERSSSSCACAIADSGITA